MGVPYATQFRANSGHNPMILFVLQPVRATSRAAHRPRGRRGEAA
ncbi:hypothetical protein [Rubrivirga sp.]